MRADRQVREQRLRAGVGQRRQEVRGRGGDERAAIEPGRVRRRHDRDDGIPSASHRGCRCSRRRGSPALPHAGEDLDDFIADAGGRPEAAPTWNVEPFDGGDEDRGFRVGRRSAPCSRSESSAPAGGSLAHRAIPASTPTRRLRTGAARTPARSRPPPARYRTTVTGLPSTEPLSMVRSSSGSSNVSAGVSGGRCPNCSISRAATELHWQLSTLHCQLHYRRKDPISLSYFDMITSHR